MPTAEAILLLTTSLAGSSNGTIKPLTPVEWGEFATWMKVRAIVPEDLLKCDLPDLLKTWQHPRVSIERIGALLNRGATLGFALEKWERAGLWVITHADVNYPEQLKRQLGDKAPATLFGCGNSDLLNTSSIAIVGSRHALESDIRFAEKIGRLAAERGESVVSGGAAGVDRAAMFGALVAEGKAIGVLSENLFRSSTSSKYRNHLIEGNLVLVSPFNPEARFTIGNAMARNKYIYCLAHHAIVVSSTSERGGTWQGAVENLKHDWVPLAVKKSEAANSGNARLVELGGRWLEDPDDVAFGGFSQKQSDAQETDGRLRSHSELVGIESSGMSNEATLSEIETNESSQHRMSVNLPIQTIEEQSVEASFDPAEDLYEKVRSLVSSICVEPQQANVIADALGVTKSTADIWVKRLVLDGVLRKLSRPVRYVVCEKNLLELS